jgi:hypothetical protein
MKYLIPILILAGCAQTPPKQEIIQVSPPVVPLKVEPMAQQMSRTEVIQATMQCEQDGLRAVPIMSKRMINGFLSDIVIDIQCLPKRQPYF